jgi:hypothetical protein
MMEAKNPVDFLIPVACNPGFLNKKDVNIDLDLWCVHQMDSSGRASAIHTGTIPGFESDWLALLVWLGTKRHTVGCESRCSMIGEEC